MRGVPQELWRAPPPTRFTGSPLPHAGRGERSKRRRRSGNEKRDQGERDGRQLQDGYRRRRNCARHLGHAGRPPESDRCLDHRGAVADRREGRIRRRDQGRGHHVGQGHVLVRRRPHAAGGTWPHLPGAREVARRGSRGDAAVRGQPQAVAALPAAGNMRQAVGRGDQRHGARRRLRALPCLPPAHRRRQRQDPRRSAGGEDRPVPRRRRHAARRADGDARRCAAVPAQGRPTPAQPRQGDEARRRGGARGRSDQDGEGLGQGQRQGQGAVGHRRLPAAGRPGLFQGRDDDVPGGERDLPARDLRQLSGGARDPAGGLRGPAAAVRSRADGRVAPLREDPAIAGGGDDDPLAVRLDGRTQQGRAAAGERAGAALSRRSASSARASWAPASPRSARRPGSTSC